MTCLNGHKAVFAGRTSDWQKKVSLYSNNNFQASTVILSLGHLKTLKRYFILLASFFSCVILSAQSKPTASFSFNGNSNVDEVTGNKARFVNVTGTKDRFGNENNAIYTHGSNYTYVNLGNYAALKQPVATISLWFRLEDMITVGRGAYVSPIIITKNGPGDDYYEAYALYYHLKTKKLTMLNSQDSTNQPMVYSRDVIKPMTWYHAVIQYNDSSLSMFLNGVRQAYIRKDFRTQFLATDSVMLGHSANKKNLRFFLGAIDDIQFFNRTLNEKEILELYHAPDPNRKAVMLKWILIVTGMILFAILLYLFIRQRIKKAVWRERERSEQVSKGLENELRVHRALMNPHFIFNTLNGLQDFILKNENEAASDYLVRFSQLLRKIMESNMSDSISLELEIELLKSYIEIESIRFEKELSCSIYVDPKIAPSITMIPIMMLQPFVENAIWHGLIAKKGEKRIELSFELSEERYVKCTIEDNGVGRSKADTDALEKTSLATKFIEQRLVLMNKIHDLQCELWIVDKANATGTIVIITLPFTK